MKRLSDWFIKDEQINYLYHIRNLEHLGQISRITEIIKDLETVGTLKLMIDAANQWGEYSACCGVYKNEILRRTNELN